MISDMLVAAALQNTIPRIVASQSAFRGLFAGLQSGVADDWRTVLANRPAKVRLAYGRGHDQFPLVVVQMQSERNTNEPLAGFGQVLDNGLVEDGTVVEQTLSLTVLAQTAEITRALATVVRAACFESRDLFLREGYVDFRYVGAEALLPEEELIAEDQGVFVRRLSVSLKEQVCVPSLEDAPTPVKLLVAASDLAASPDNDSPSGWVYDAAGTAGGASPQE